MFHTLTMFFHRSCYKASHKEKIKIMCLVNYFTHCFCNLWTEPMAEGSCHQLMAIFEYIYMQNFQNQWSDTAIDINVRPAARGRLKRPRSDKLSTSAARVKFSYF